MSLRRLAYGFSSTILSVSALFVLVSPVAHAANVTWDGEGGDSKFSTATNWSGDTLPTASDVIVFDADNITGTATLDNDISNLIVAGISFMATTLNGVDQKDVIVNGNGITVNGDITHTGGAFNYPQINVDITLGTDMVIDGPISISGSSVTGKSIDLNGHNLSVTNTLTNTSLYSDIIGSGNLDLSPTGFVSLHGGNTFTGNVQVSGEVWASNINSFGNAANSVTVSGSAGRIDFCSIYGGTIQNPFILDSSFSMFGVINSTSACGWYAAEVVAPSSDIIFSGPITLLQNTSLFPTGAMSFTGALSGTFTLTIPSGIPGTLIINGSSNSTSTQNGMYTSSLRTTTVSDTAHTNQTVSYNQVLIISHGAIAGDITMYNGTLKGTGSVGNISLFNGSIAPGMSPGILSSGNVTFTSGTFDEEIGGTASGEYDQLNVTGTVDLGSSTTLNVSHWNGYRPVVGNSFTIINNDGADAITGAFSGLAQGATVTVDGVAYTISYTGGDGNDVVLTATTVPAATVAAPNTGFELLNNNPLMTLVITLLSVAGIGFVARKQLVQKK